MQSKIVLLQQYTFLLVVVSHLSSLSWGGGWALSFGQGVTVTRTNQFFLSVLEFSIYFQRKSYFRKTKWKLLYQREKAKRGGKKPLL